MFNVNQNPISKAMLVLLKSGPSDAQEEAVKD